MTRISIEQAQLNLPELVRTLKPDDEVLIIENERAIARLLPMVEEQVQVPRKFGSMRGTVLYIAPDFDAPLEDFREYME